jgi:dihydrofolate synthase / folylpolyglutamate synthase
MELAGPPVLTPDRLDRPFLDPLVARLFPPLATGVHWGLERTERALEALGDPHLEYPTLHVSGTNGKGSVVSTLASVLNASGLRAGCYTSPHLCSFRERMMVGGEALTDDVILRYAEEIRDAVIRFGLTFFEAVTVLGFHAFAREGAEIAVIEVGLGGRLDATNVVRPEVAAVTNVAMDHSDYLGNTLDAIAREKAAIAKPGIPLLTAEPDPEILEAFRDEARKAGAPLVRLPPDCLSDVAVATDHTAFRVETSTWGPLSVRTPLVGRHQATNAALAIEMLGNLPEALRPNAETVVEGISRVRYAGRDQIETVDGLTWLFDVAHNTAGIRSLVDTLDRLDLPTPRVALVGVLGDKDWRTMLPPLFSRVDAAVLTQPPSAPPERRWDPRAAARAVRTITHVRLEVDFERAMEEVRRLAGEGTVVVTGSVHTVGGALRLLGREPLGVVPTSAELP